MQMEQDQEKIAAYKDEITLLKQELEAQKKKLEDQKETIIRQAREKAADVLQEAKDYADETIRIINKTTSDNGVSRLLEEERTKLRNRLNNMEPGLTAKQPSARKKKLDAAQLHVGDTVKVLSMNLTGTVSSLPNAKGEVFVQMGIFRSAVPVSDLELVDVPTISGDGVPQGKPRKGAGNTGSIRMSKSATISPECNLIGMTVDEALPAMDKYLDDAYLAHMEKVRVVHGRGTGALRNAVHQHLRKLKYVKSFRLGEFGEGDSGVTIVEFK